MSGAKKILKSLEEIQAWISEENGQRMLVHLPDGTQAEMTYAEYVAWQIAQEEREEDRL